MQDMDFSFTGLDILQEHMITDSPNIFYMLSRCLVHALVVPRGCSSRTH